MQALLQSAFEMWVLVGRDKKTPLSGGVGSEEQTGGAARRTDRGQAQNTGDVGAANYAVRASRLC